MLPFLQQIIRGVKPSCRIGWRREEKEERGGEGRRRGEERGGERRREERGGGGEMRRSRKMSKHLCEGVSCCSWGGSGN